MASIKDELLMRALQGPEQEAFLNIWRTQDRLLSEMSELYKSQDITVAQYNALRILRGAGKAGLPCQGVGERMVARVPDITRLLDRLEDRGLVSRQRDTDDRRVVMVHATQKALDLLIKLDGTVRDAHERQFRHLTKTELRELNRLLTKVRKRGGSDREENSS